MYAKHIIIKQKKNEHNEKVFLTTKSSRYNYQKKKTDKGIPN